MNRHLVLLVACIALLGAAAIAAEEPWSADWPAHTTTAVVPGGIVLTGTAEPCLPDNEGAARYDSAHKTLIFCDGAAWQAVRAAPLGGEGGTAP